MPDLTRTLLASLLGRRLPITEGALQLIGPNATIRVRRDRFGIPHIDARSDADAWFGLGFCMGQDRAFQIEGLVRVARGTVAALLGKDAVPLDRISRRIGFRRSAEATAALIGDRDRKGLEAFTAGVNAGRTKGLERRPHEFALLRATPTPVDVPDLLAVASLQAFALAANWDSELARLEILRRDGAEALRAVDPTYPEWHPVTDPPLHTAGPAIDALQEDLSRFLAVIGAGGGSNNWALAGSKTHTGRPIVANDPHLAPVLPPHWYLAHLDTPEWSVAGAAFAGTPGFLAAHNGHVAWGITAGLVDNTDLFFEELGEDGRSVRRGDEWVACEVHREVIEVRGGESVTEGVLVTPAGPIIGPALIPPEPAIAMAATWLQPHEAGFLLDIVRATSVEDLRAAAATWHGPTLNLVMADTEGHIGWQLIGQAPRRRSGKGTLPLAAWDPDVGWDSPHLTTRDLPGSRDPEAGFVATANHRPVAGDEPFLGVDFIDGYRKMRIDELLSGRDDWDVASTLQMQLDTFSIPWRELRDHLLGVGHRGTSARVYRLLQEFDGDLSADSAAATAFVLTVKELQRLTVAAKAPHSVDAALGRPRVPEPLTPWAMTAFRRTGHLVALLRDRPEGWFPEGWDEAIAAAMAAVEERLDRDFGRNPTRWKWGDVRPLWLRHPAGQRGPLERLFDLGPFRWSGDFETVSQSGAPPLDPLANPSAIASLRMVIDVGDWDRSRFSLPGGQSGNPASPHYDDQVEPWRTGIGVPMPWSKAAVEAAAVTTLVLVPQTSTAAGPT